MTWPHQIGIIPTEADCFQQRVAVEELDSAISQGGTAVICQVLAGTGGVGKTQLAAHYVRRQWAARTVDLLVWVVASNREAVVSTYADAGRQLSGANGTDADQAAQQFLAWLAATDRSWLIVLDDLADPAALNGLWPPEHSTGRALITTRRQDAVLTTGSRRLVRVGLFNLEEATSYVSAKLQRHRLHDDLQQIRQLVADLGFLPLALAQAAAYMADRRLSCSEYRRRLADRKHRLAEILPEESALPDEQHATVSATWSLSVELANQLSPVGLAHPILRLASMLDANGIPIAALTSPSAVTYLNSQRTSFAGKELREATTHVEEYAARDALLCLHRLSLVDVAERNIRVHALIQRVTRDELENANEGFDSVMTAAAESLLQVWPIVEKDMGSEILRTNADALHANAGPRLWAANAHPVLFRAGFSLGKAGLNADAVNYWKHLQLSAELSLGPDHADTLAVRAFRARAQADSGDRSGAILAAERLLGDQTRALGPDHLDTLATRIDLANWQGRSGYPAKAANAMKEALANQIKVLGVDHPDTWTTRRALIHWLTLSQKPSAAVSELEKLLVNQIQLLGSDHREVLGTRFRLAIQWSQLREPIKAIDELKKIFVIQQRVLGPGDADTLKTSRNIEFLEKQISRGQVSKNPKNVSRQRHVVSLLEQYMWSRIQIAGESCVSSPILNRTINQLRGSDQKADVVKAFSDLLIDISEVLGPNHRETLAVRGTLAEHIGRSGQHAERVLLLEALLDDVVRILGSDDRAALGTLAHLARSRYKAGDLSGAIDTAELLLREQRRALGDSHPHSLMTLKQIIRWRAEIAL